MGILKSQPEFYKKKIWPVDLGKQYEEDIKDIAFTKRFRILDSRKITASYKESIDKSAEAGLCAGWVEKAQLPKITVRKPLHSRAGRGSLDSKELLAKALMKIDDLESKMEELKK